MVQTATGECLPQQSANGSPLTRDSVTPIIPLGEIVGIGGKITWLTNKCSLSHPDLGSIAVKVQSNCSYVPETNGPNLIQLC